MSEGLIPNLVEWLEDNLLYQYAISILGGPTHPVGIWHQYIVLRSVQNCVCDLEL